jgi:hypothetical protein
MLPARTATFPPVRGPRVKCPMLAVPRSHTGDDAVAGFPCLVCAAMLAILRHMRRGPLRARPQIILLKPLTWITVETN